MKTLFTTLYIALVLLIVLLLESTIHKFSHGYWRFEDDIHVVQIVTTPSEYEIRNDYVYLIFDETEIEAKERTRPKPYKLITIYKGIKITDYGDMKYLANIKCKRYNEAENVYLKEIAQIKQDELKQERYESKLEKEMDSIKNLKCN
jgi:hypothetical protein